MGIRYYGLMEEVAMMKDATNLWENKGLVWAQLMNDRHIKGNALRKIHLKQNDPSI